MPKNKRRFEAMGARPPHPVAPPRAIDRGLSSRLNYDWAVQVLERSSHKEVTDLLKRVRFGVVGAPAQPSLDDALAAFMRTADGQEEFGRAKEAALKREADAWLRTRAGQENLEKVKASLLASELAGNSDVYEKSCRREIQTQIARWLQSPRGQEAVEQERQRIVRRQATPAAAPASKAGLPSWVEQTLKKADNNG